jgi:hypothetical protein
MAASSLAKLAYFEEANCQMFDEPQEDPAERTIEPADRAREKADKLRMHAELAAVFEGCRKFEAQIIPGLDVELARDVQRTIAKLEKVKVADTPVVPPESMEEAARILNLSQTGGLSTNDYHIHRRPGEVMMIRWLAGEQVETFYQRLQAHFDAAIAGTREDEREAHAWKQDPKLLAYLAALDGVEVKMAERYLREIIRQHRIFVLSTQTADEINIKYLCDYVMEVPIAEVVGNRAAPKDETDERDLAWFFKIFSLRGMTEGEEKMCFFTYLQKTEDTFESD